MEKRKKIDQLYVATMMYKFNYLESPWEQYGSSGTIYHMIILLPIKRLVYSTKNDKGETEYYDYLTNKKIEEVSPKVSFFTDDEPYPNICRHIDSLAVDTKSLGLSHVTPSSLFKNIDSTLMKVCGKKDWQRVYIKKIPESLLGRNDKVEIEDLEIDKVFFSYFVPITEYLKSQYSLEGKEIDPKKANKLVQMSNITNKRWIILSNDLEKAKQQLKAEIGYNGQEGTREVYSINKSDLQTDEFREFDKKWEKSFNKQQQNTKKITDIKTPISSNKNGKGK